MMYIDRMSNDELERLYYSAGMPEIAAIYAQIADVGTERDELSEAVDASVSQGDYDKLQKDYDDLESKITAAREQVDELRQRIEINKRLKKGGVLAALNDLDLETT